MKLKIAVFSDSTPKQDYIDILTAPDDITPQQAIEFVNTTLLGWHCELITVIEENARS